MYRKSFDYLKSNFSDFILITLAYMIIVSGISYFVGIFIPIIGTLISVILTQISITCYNRFLMNAMDKENDNISFSSRLKSVMTNLKSPFFKVCAVSLVRVVLNSLVTLFFGAGVLLSVFSSNLDIMSIIFRVLALLLILVITNIISDMFIGLTLYLALDEDYNSKSLKSTFVDGFKMMKGYRVKFIGIKIIASILNFLGTLLLGVGVLITMPLTSMATIELYNESKKNYFK